MDESFLNSYGDSNEKDEESFNRLMIIDDSQSNEIELMKQLGLPVSFTSNIKSTNKKTNAQKRKNNQLSSSEKRAKFSSSEKKRIKIFKKRRESLFSKWSLIEQAGIKIDGEMYYSITPEEYAKRIAIYCKNKVDYTILIDGFCGVGGNLIQFALKNPNAFMIGIDLCAKRIENAQRIAQIYNVEHQCDFICGDYLQIACTLKIRPDIIFLSPPWGGCLYKKKTRFCLRDLPVDGNQIFNVSKKLTKNLAFYLPRNQCIDDLDLLKEDYSLDFNISPIFGQTLNVYFGDLVDEDYLLSISDANPFKNSSDSVWPLLKSRPSMAINFAGNDTIKKENETNQEIRDNEVLYNSTKNESMNEDLLEDKNNNLIGIKTINKKLIFQTLEDKKCALM